MIPYSNYSKEAQRVYLNQHVGQLRIGVTFQLAGARSYDHDWAWTASPNQVFEIPRNWTYG